MTGIYLFCSRLSSLALGLCVVFAMLTLPPVYAEPADCPQLCHPYLADPVAYNDCMQACLAGLPYCGAHQDCDLFTSKDLCVPGFNRICAMDKRCACRWILHPIIHEYKCLCQIK